jgi:ubiquinone/menaquinone biosynthesis C-methylase UbiE
LGLYSNYIFPRLLDWTLGNATLDEHRREALAPLRGDVLEIGFGTGLNLPFYPDQVTKLTALDSERMLPKRVEKRIAHARVPVDRLQLDASGRLPFEDDVFDGIVTTLTLCSIADVESALAEIRRVLKPDGEYVFLEHGRSDDPRVATRQDFWNPIQKLIACGCNMNRPIDLLIKGAGMEMIELDRYRLPDTPRILGEIYRGVATKVMR